MTPRLLLLCALAGCSATATSKPTPAPLSAKRMPPDPAAERAAIVRVFDDYVAKVVRGDRSGAVALIDRDTMDYYEALRRDSLSLSAAELKQRSFEDQILIIAFRTGKTADHLRAQKIEELVAAAIIPAGSMTASMRLGEITLRGDRASAKPRVGEIEVPIAFDFHRDPGGWRLSFIEVTRAAIARIHEGDPEGMLRALAVYYKMDLEALYEPLP